MKEVPAFLLITWKHFKNLKVRLGRPPGFDRNIFNLRYGEQYNVPIAVPLNQTVIVLVILAVTDNDPSRSWVQRK